MSEDLDEQATGAMRGAVPEIEDDFEDGFGRNNSCEKQS
jgi:hypothetical protein